MDYNSQGGGYPAQGNPNSAGYADTSPTYDSSASTYTGYDNTTTATSETCFGNQVDHDQFKGEELTGQLALPEASVTDTGEDLPDYSEHLNLPRVTLTGDAFHFGDNMPDSDPTKYLYDEDFQNQTTWASQLSIGEVRGTYPEEFSNIERFDFTKKNGAPLASFPLMPHGKTYRSGEPGALRTIFNRDDLTEAIPAYHDTVEQRRKEDERRQRLEAKKQKAQRDLDSKRAEIQRKQEQIPRETSPQKLKKLHADLGIQFKHLANLVRKVNSCDEQLLMPREQKNAPFRQGSFIPEDPLSPLASMTLAKSAKAFPYSEKHGGYLAFCLSCRQTSYIFDYAKVENKCLCATSSA